MSHPDHGEGVSPPCPISGLPGSDCAPKSQPAQRQGQESSISGEDSCVQRHSENLAHASSMAKASVSAGLTTLTWWLALPPALKEQSPRTLDVLHRWDALQKSAVIAQNSFQMGCNEVWVTKRCSENFDALQLRGAIQNPSKFPEASGIRWRI